MDVGFEHQLDGEAQVLRPAEDGIGRGDTGLAGLVVIVEHRIDNGGVLSLGVADEIADRVAGLIEEGVDDGFAHARQLLGDEFS